MLFRSIHTHTRTHHKHLGANTLYTLIHHTHIHAYARIRKCHNPLDTHTKHTLLYTHTHTPQTLINTHVHILYTHSLTIHPQNLIHTYASIHMHTSLFTHPHTHTPHTHTHTHNLRAFCCSPFQSLCNRNQFEV